MESKNIYVTVFYYYTKYIKVINHGKINYPPNIFIIFHSLHQPYYNIIISGPFFFWKFRFTGHKNRTAGLYKHVTHKTYFY